MSDSRRPYPSVPQTGKHRGVIPKIETSSNVRAQTAPPEPATRVKDVKPVFRVTRHSEDRYYRIRAWTTDIVDRQEEATEEVGVYHSAAELRGALGQLGTAPRFAVFENTQSGELHVERARDVAGDWTDGGRFDQVTIFDTAEEAEAYANRGLATP